MDWFRRTTGIGQGHVHLQLIESALPLGGTLRGRVRLELVEPTEGKELVLQIKATQRVLRTNLSRVSTVSAGRRSTRTTPGLSHSNSTLWSHELRLEGPRTFRDGEGFDFALPLPASLQTQPNFGDHPIGEIAQVLDALQTPVRGEPEWTVTAVFKRPMAVNLRDKLELVVR
jgi:hypothetical protein